MVVPGGMRTASRAPGTRADRLSLIRWLRRSRAGAHDARWSKALGDLVTTAVSLASTIRVPRVFPFGFTGYAFGWTPLVCLVPIVGVAGTALAMVIQLVALIRRLAELSTRDL